MLALVEHERPRISAEQKGNGDRKDFLSVSSGIPMLQEVRHARKVSGEVDFSSSGEEEQVGRFE